MPSLLDFYPTAGTPEHITALSRCDFSDSAGVLVAGPRGSGKTIIGLQCALDAALKGGRVVYVCNRNNIVTALSSPSMRFVLDRLGPATLSKIEFVYVNSPAEVRRVLLRGCCSCGCSPSAAAAVSSSSGGGTASPTTGASPGTVNINATTLPASAGPSPDSTRYLHHGNTTNLSGSSQSQRPSPVGPSVIVLDDQDLQQDEGTGPAKTLGVATAIVSHMREKTGALPYAAVMPFFLYLTTTEAVMAHTLAYAALPVQCFMHPPRPGAGVGAGQRQQGSGGVTYVLEYNHYGRYPSSSSSLVGSGSGLSAVEVDAEKPCVNLSVTTCAPDESSLPLILDCTTTTTTTSSTTVS